MDNSPVGFHSIVLEVGSMETYRQFEFDEMTGTWIPRLFVECNGDEDNELRGKELIKYINENYFGSSIDEKLKVYLDETIEEFKDFLNWSLIPLDGVKLRCISGPGSEVLTLSSPR